MRLFFAVNLPADERDRLYGAVAPLRAAGLPVRWVPPENLHVTLWFLGTVPQPRVAAVREAGARAAAGVGAFDLRLEGVGAFPNARRPRVIWIGVADAEPLRRLHAALGRALAPLGFAPEDRPFQPHVTLGRVRDNARPADLARFGELAGAVAYAGAFPVHSLDLMRSELSPQGARYERIGAAPLG